MQAFIAGLEKAKKPFPNYNPLGREAELGKKKDKDDKKKKLAPEEVHSEGEGDEINLASPHLTCQSSVKSDSVSITSDGLRSEGGSSMDIA